MRLFAKIFLCATLVLSSAILLSGYLLITDSYKNTITRETEHALTAYQYDKFTVQSALLSETESPDTEFFCELAGTLTGQVAFFSENQELLYTTLTKETTPILPTGCTNETSNYYFLKSKNTTYIAVCGKVTQDETELYLLTASDITSVLDGYHQMTTNFGKIYFTTLAVSAVVIFLLTFLLVRPIKRLTTAADRIANGQYGERLITSGGDEIAMLSDSFNLMAQAVEDRMEELSQNAQQKEDFVASFAHELKTPLTSVIGYADMLYQKSLPSETVKDAAHYILQEGLRLESLSLKLMDLIVLEKQNFALEDISAQDLLQNVTNCVETLTTTHHITLHKDFAPAFVLAEFDLFKTLLLNLLDNAVKSQASEIWISGKVQDTSYVISVIDNGCGIPPAELSRITEAFYMVDKARARTQHSIGLGLALAQRIAELHGDSLHFNSALGAGTTVSFSLSYKGGDTL